MPELRFIQRYLYNSRTRTGIFSKSLPASWKAILTLVMLRFHHKMQRINSNEPENSNETDVENKEFLSMLFGRFMSIFADF